MYLELHGKHFKTTTYSTRNTFRFLSSSHKTLLYISGRGSIYLHMFRYTLMVKETRVLEVCCLSPLVSERKRTAAS